MTTLEHGTKKIAEDNHHRYFESEHGIKIVPHSEEWAGYYRLGDECDVILTAFSYGKAPGVVAIPIRTFEDLSRHYCRTPELHWTDEGDGNWSAASRHGDAGVSFSYRIRCQSDGSYNVSASDPELVGSNGVPSFATLVDAQGYCLYLE